MFRLLFLAILIFSTVQLSALEIDEKLTMRILKVSTSKKTMLINRGLEDGLVVGDHAKFFLTTGVVARGVVVKASPSRSIWSVYRRVVPQRIMPDQVLNLKVATPVRLTPDRSRMIHPEPSFEPSTPTNVVLAAGADEENLTPQARRDFEAVSANDYGEQKAAYGRFAEKSYEAYLELGFSSMSTSADGSNGSSRKTDLGFILGFEKYFPNSSSFTRKLSAVAIVGYGSTTTTASDASGNSVSSTVSHYEIGGGGHFHFLEDPSTFGKLIGYTGLLFGIGRKNSGSDASSASDETVTSSATFILLPLGLKYYVRNGFGGRVSINYQHETVSTAYEEETSKVTMAGFVFHIGMQYRF